MVRIIYVAVVVLAILILVGKKNTTALSAELVDLIGEAGRVLLALLRKARARYLREEAAGRFHAPQPVPVPARGSAAAVPAPVPPSPPAGTEQPPPTAQPPVAEPAELAPRR